MLRFLCQFLLLFALLFTLSSAEKKVVIDDPLTNSTIGKLVSGHILPDGYRSGRDMVAIDCIHGTGPCYHHNHIFYQLPATISSGYITFEIKGMQTQDFPKDEEIAWFAMYDGSGIDEEIDYFDDFKQNFNRLNSEP